MVCPNCNGTGKRFPDSQATGRIPASTEPCGSCDGNGEVAPPAKVAASIVNYSGGQIAVVVFEGADRREYTLSGPRALEEALTKAGVSSRPSEL